ncbi:MAG: hypothetical protein NVSMB53_14410 [Gemmatimonadaceae bacterium]
MFGPAAEPSVQFPTVAVPSGPVVKVAPVTDPPPPVTTNVTGAPPIGDPVSSRTSTEGGSATGAPGGAVKVVEELAAMLVATWLGPETSLPQASCTTRTPTGGSELKMLHIDFIPGNIIRNQVASRTDQGKGQRKDLA